MNSYSISYVTNSGLTVLNNVVTADSFSDAIDDIKGDTGVQMILSCVSVQDV